MCLSAPFTTDGPLGQFACILLVLAIGTGCAPEEQITTYTQERTSPPSAPLDPQAVQSQLDRTWAAMLPLGEQVWFFKISGPSPAVERHVAEADEFLATVRSSDDKEKPVVWELPEGWQERGPSEMRLATLTIPDEEKELELAVSSLPRGENWDDFVQVNVNRWLGQLSQPDLAKQTILNLAKQVKTPAGEATVFELSGVLKSQPGMSGPMRNPHAGMTAQQSTAQQSTSPKSSSASAAEISEFSYDAPEGWTLGGAAPMRVATFKVDAEGKQGEIAVSKFPVNAGPQITDVEANVARWAGQVGIQADAGLDSYIQKMEIDDASATLARLIPEQATDATPAMLGAMFTRGDQVWFVKFTGEASLLKSQEENFRSFLASLRFK